MQSFFPFIYKTHCFCSSNLETFHVRTYIYIYLCIYIQCSLVLWVAFINYSFKVFFYIQHTLIFTIFEANHMTWADDMFFSSYLGQVKTLLGNIGALGCKQLPVPSKQKVLLIVQVASEHLKHGLFTLCVSLVFLLSLFHFVLHQIPHIPQSCEKVGVFFTFWTQQKQVFFLFIFSYILETFKMKKTDVLL